MERHMAKWLRSVQSGRIPGGKPANDGPPNVTPPAPYNFNVDRITPEEISGWAADAANPNRPLALQFLLDGVAVGVVTTDLARADVEKAGRGGRHCGFRWSPPKPIAAAAVAQKKPIELVVLGPQPHSLTRIVLSQDPSLTPKVREAMRPALERAITDAALLRHLADGAPVERHEPGRFPLHEKMFSFRGSASGELGTALSPYLAFTHRRLRREESHPLDGSEFAKNAYLRWYLDTYGGNRKPLRVPLGADEIEYLNAPVSLVGIPFKISRASYSYAVNLPVADKLFPLKEPADYDNFVAWWAAEQAPALNMEDCLVPDYYVEVLRRMTVNWMGKGFAPSVFMNRVFDRDEKYHRLDRFSEPERMILHVWYLLDAAERPDLIRYIPAKNLNAVFEGPRGQTLFDRMIQSIHNSGPQLAEVFNAEIFAELLYRRGFDLLRRRFTFRDVRGNRFAAAAEPPVRAPADRRIPLQVIGPFEKSSGLGQAARLSAATLERTRYTTNFVDFGLDNPAPVGMSTQLSKYNKPVPAKVNLIHLNGETVPIALAYMPDLFNGAYNIGYFFWELSTPAPAQHLALELLDEIWVATEFGVSVYEPAVDKPVRNVGMAFEPVEEPERGAARAWIAERMPIGPDTFVYLATFDSFSFLERKNPHGLVDAFRAAFAADEDVLLILKTHNRDFVMDRHQTMRWDRIVEIASADPRIAILNETLHFADLIKLKKGSDCYVSLHRSEGWGFGLIEAMSIGVPILTTAYSGNMDFTRPDNAFLVDYELIEPEFNEYLFVSRGQVWADPKMDSAIAQLRAVRADRAERERRAAAGRAFVYENFSLDAQARKYTARLDEIFATLG